MDDKQRYDNGMAKRRVGVQAEFAPLAERDHRDDHQDTAGAVV